MLVSLNGRKGGETAFTAYHRGIPIQENSFSIWKNKESIASEMVVGMMGYTFLEFVPL